MTEHSGLSIRWMVALMLAFVAGAAALTVQIVCTRVAIQLFGASTVTISSMIAMSLLGLALGAWSAGALANRALKPARMLVISFFLTALLLEFLAILARPLGQGIQEVVEQMNSPVSDFAAAQLIFSMMTMLPINILLGGVIPILIKLLPIGSPNPNPGSWSTGFGRLYAMETAGAAIGALFVGFWSIQHWGLQFTLHLFAGLVCCCSLISLRSTGSHTAALTDRPAAEPAAVVRAKRHQLLLPLVVLVGFANLGMEVIWQRLLVILFGSDTHSYSIVAATYLIGIALGAVISPLAICWTTNQFRTYALATMAIGISSAAATAVMMFVMGNEPATIGSRFLLGYPVAARIVISFALLFVPTVAMGIAFPVAAHCWIIDGISAARRTGQIYAAALVGNVIGVLACGYVLVPMFGLRISMLLLSGLCMGAGLATWLASNWLACGVVADSHFVPPNWRRTRLASTAFAAALICTWGAIAVPLLQTRIPLFAQSSNRDWAVDFYLEGPVNTVAVVRRIDDPKSRRMLIDGITIGESVSGVDEKQQMLAHLPFLLRPEARDQNVLTIGLGTGILTGELAEIPAVSKIQCIELSPTVILAAKSFSDLNGDIFSNPAVQITQSDGIQYLNRQIVDFDVIISDAKSKPGHAGNVAFFSRDYYRLCASRLSGNGMFVQWVSLQTSQRSIGSILRTFADVFPFGQIAIAAPDSIYLVGSRQPISIARQPVDKLLSQNFAGSLTRYNWRSIDDLASMYWLDQSVVSRFAARRFPVNTYDKPILESYALDSLRKPASTINRNNLELLQSMIQFDAAGDLDDTSWNGQPLQFLEDSGQREKILAGRMAAQEILSAELLVLKSNKDWLDQSAAHYRKALEFLPDLTRQNRLASVYRQIAERARQDNNLNREFSALANISDLRCSSAADEFRLGMILSGLRKPAEALSYLFRATKLAKSDNQYRAEFGLCLLELGKDDQASFHFQQVLAADADHPLANFGLGIGLARINEMAAAREHLQRAIQIDETLADRLERFDVAIDLF